MATFNFTKYVSQNIGTTEQVVYQVPSGQSSLVISLNLANKKNTGITVNVVVVDALSTDEISILHEVPLPQGSSLPSLGRQKIILQENDQVKVSASEADAVDAILSVIEDVN